MAASMTMGLPGVRLTPGDHICAFFRGARERDALLVPYLREGLRAGDMCLCVTDDPTAAVGELVAESASDPELARGRLRSTDSESTYLADGCFVIDRMLGFWETEVGGAVVRDGFDSVRSVGEMTWALSGRPGVEGLISYESRLNDFLPRYPLVALCLYDLERFSDGEIVVEILQTHPAVLIGGELVENPWYTDPHDYLGRRPATAS
ncbi:MEDS domain-containing protein [Actinomycetospora endophytica]|uniref:MEDS domain-containing protein n=1 Tax=Actinomycetospora endophytica TaxID=2291215 RepID=A0ABS8P5U2_9PSEU|nr:MEDS domain-containing protein [Actinomycetospora endophytica]MCD2192920.1 MEDS domain-containing protein [Actinomycetospora endophytica]